jgi:hypothetical protein
MSVSRSRTEVVTGLACGRDFGGGASGATGSGAGAGGGGGSAGLAAAGSGAGGGGGGGRYRLDFNRARNPFCAYSSAYPCPAPWAGNTIPAPVMAGERYETVPR